MLLASGVVASPTGGALARWVFTDALAPEGGNQGDFGGFNLGDHVGDDPAAVATNRARLAAELGIEHVVYMNQVHGAEVSVVAGPWPSVPPPGDGVVTSSAGLGLAVLVADCVPVLLADPVAGVVAAAHAGRAGMTKGVVAATVQRMRQLGGDAIEAIIGPSICGRCYEVPEAMRTEVAEVAPLAATLSWTGTPGLDVAAGVVAQLAELDIPVTWQPGCTRENPQLYSYRRQARTGRFAGVIWLSTGG